MDINLKVRPNHVITPFYLFFVVSAMQLGVGTMGVPGYIYKYAKQDFWIAILISFLAMIIVISTMFLILKQYENADIFGIHIDVFGKWLGRLFGTIYVVYFGITLLSIMLTYIQVIQVFLYPTIPSLALGIMFIILTIYSVFGGLRIIVGMCFLFFFISQLLTAFLYAPFMEMDWSHFLPMFTTSIPDILEGARATTYSVGGFEILFFLYPFIQDKKRVKKPVIFALLYTTIIILLITMISIGFYSLDRLVANEWSTLTLFKIVTFSFVERLDYLVVVIWLTVVLPNFVLLMWGMMHGMKRMYNIPKKVTIYTLSGILLVLITVINEDQMIIKITDFVAQVGFWLIFVYPIILLPLVLVKKKWRQRKKERTT